MLRAFMSLTHKQFFSLVIWWLNVTLAIAVSPMLSLQAEVTFPYTATVQSDQATVHGGPGEDFYTTDPVPRGAKVEVYRHDQNDWCAIRPPATSFSWIAAEHLEITDNPALARVINVPVKTRVGSNFGDIHDIEYISLRQGEIVELVGSQMLADSAADSPLQWFKIAPPSGEFRWIHSRYLNGKRDATKSETPLQPMTIKTYPLPAPGETVTSPKNDKADSQSADDGNRASLPEADSTGFTDRDQLQPISYEAPLAETPLVETPLVETPLAQETPPSPPRLATAVAEPKQKDVATHVNVVTWEAVSSPTDPLASPEPRAFVDQYNALNVMLSRAILGDIETWKLEKLRAQTDMLVDAAETVDEQRLSTGLADKVAEFQSLQQRSSDLASADGAVQTVSATSAASKPLPLPTFKTDAALPKLPTTAAAYEMPQRVKSSETRSTIDAAALSKEESIDNSVFDASGTLVMVKSRRPGLPTYAITNSNGEVVKFLSTRDGSSLTQFVNKEVGVLGKLGFIRKLSKAHVVADRVVLLQR